MLIPKIIHQTISIKENLNHSIEQNLRTIKEMNGDWECRLYDENDRRKFISSTYDRRVLKIYEKIRPEYGAAKADLFRYLLIHEIGGVYLDIKSTTPRPLSEVIEPDDSYILSHWDNKPDGRNPGYGIWKQFGVENEFQQWHIMAAPKHPYLSAVIKRVLFNVENYDPLRNGVGKLGVLLTTGPISYTRAISPIQDAYSHRVVQIEDLGVMYSFIERSNARHADFGLTNYRRNRFPLTSDRLSSYRAARLFLLLKFRKFLYHPEEPAAQLGNIF